MLNIVDGTSAETVLEKSGIKGETLEWGDVLHEGPFYKFMSIDETVVSRGAFLEKNFDLKKNEAINNLKRRNSIVAKNIDAGEDIIIWGSEELYDQLIVLESIWLLKQLNCTPDKIFLVHVAGNIGTASLPDRIIHAFDKREQCTLQHLEVGYKCWEFYRKGDFNGLFEQNISLFPFMSKAMRRILQEVPDIRTGLSRSENQILRTLINDELSAVELFLLCNEQEDPPFMGDSSFFIILEGLSSKPSPLMVTHEGKSYRRGGRDKLKVTETGHSVLKGKLNMLDLKAVNRWVGGMHIQGSTDK